MPVTRRTSKRKRLPRARSAPVDSFLDFEKLLAATSTVQRYSLRLYITGTSPRSTAAVANIRALCEDYLKGKYDLVVIDIYQQPRQAMAAQIIAVPTLVKKSPRPPRRLVGNLSDRDKVLVGLDLRARAPNQPNAS